MATPVAASPTPDPRASQRPLGRQGLVDGQSRVRQGACPSAAAQASGVVELTVPFINRRRFLQAVSAGLLAPPLAEAQQAAKVARNGHLVNNLAASKHMTEAFRQGLRDLGYVEGRNFVLEIRSAEGKPERFPALAAELVALKVDVIVTGGGTPGALAAKQATRTIPIVFGSSPDPVTDGLVTSLARPGGNVTGLSARVPNLVGKHLELLKQAVPSVSR